LWRWLSSDALRPWQHRRWIFPRDPEFAAKAGQVLDLYERVWEGSPLGVDDFVLSADEKTSVQARRRKQPTLAPAAARPMRVEHEYFRESAWPYWAAWDVHRAKVFGRCESKNGIGPRGSTGQRGHEPSPYRTARRVVWIMDNCSAHRGRRPPTVSAPSGPMPFWSIPRSMPVGSTRSRSTCRSFKEKFSPPTTSVLWANSKSGCWLSRPTTNIVPLPSGGPSPARSARSADQTRTQIPWPWQPNPESKIRHRNPEPEHLATSSEGSHG